MGNTHMFGKLRQLVSGRRDVTAVTPSAAAEPPALVIARRERVVGADWAGAKSWFGGAPKLGDTPWPRDKKGTPLYFLAQLDLSEIAAAGHGRTALPTEGSFAFFVGGEQSGGIVHVKRPGIHATPAPDDLGKAEDIGGDPSVDRSHRFGPSSFPCWPVEFRALSSAPRINEPDDDEVMDRAREEQAEAIARLYQTREYNFSAAYAAKTAALGEVPLYWLSALMFAERVPRMRDQVAKARARGASYIESSTARLMALEAGLPAPTGQGPFGDPTKERANAESWLAIGRKAIADADAHQASVEAYVAKVEAAAMGADPWKEISPEEANELDTLFGEARSKALEDFARYLLPRSWRDYASDAIKLMAAGPDEAYARLPKAWRDLINTHYRLPAGGAHLMFGIGANIQGNEMFEYPDMRMVLQLTHDDIMYWPFGDNGVYQFWMPVSALRAGDVSKAKVTFEAH
jgi:hypothetical protein